MFRSQPGIKNQLVERTFENVRRVLEPTLYAKHVSCRMADVLDPSEFGESFPIPYHIDPVTEGIGRAWTTGSMIIENTTVGESCTVDVHVYAATIGAAPVLLTTVTCVLVAGATMKHFRVVLQSQDLSGYDIIVVRYEVDIMPAVPVTMSTSIRWRPAGV